MKNNRYLIYILTLIFVNAVLHSQNLDTSEKVKVKNANEYFKKGDIQQAKKNFEGLTKNIKTSKYGNYGLGVASLKEKDNDKALKYFENVIAKEKTLTKDEKHSVYHNMGNIMYAKGDYGKAVEYYENALINNPNDDETRYNLVMAQKMINKQNNQNNQNQNNDNKNKDDNKDKNKNDKNQSSKNDNLNNNNSSQAERQDISDSEAQQLLQTFKQDEERTRDRLMKQQTNGKKPNKKNW